MTPGRYPEAEALARDILDLAARLDAYTNQDNSFVIAVRGYRISLEEKSVDAVAKQIVAATKRTEYISGPGRHWPWCVVPR